MEKFSKIFLYSLIVVAMVTVTATMYQTFFMNNFELFEYDEELDDYVPYEESIL